MTGTETKESATTDIVLKLTTALERLLLLEESSYQIDLGVTTAMFWDGQTRRLHPISRPVKVDLDSLLNIEVQKKRVLANTTNFIKGKKANNVLLWGEKGTGKSSLIKGLLKKFAPVGLRMIQVLNRDILTIHYIYDFIYRHSYYRFIIFIDDLSFEEDQTNYKALKTIMDGGLQEIPENMLFYVTSNRRHLIPTRFSDRDGDIVNPSDNLEEKVSLVDRFGLRLGFYKMDEEAYLRIVDMYASKYNVHMEPQLLHRLAKQWSIETGGRNGRIAEQFIRSL
jgi:predicted AAA+ superfamily ATPase